ncbi:MAG: AAA family ATPase, partial [Elusimicrobia bacterium]|nr:AAA family ATPase [Elusimicrobiota bacterium]
MQKKNNSQLAATILPLAVILLAPSGAFAGAVKTGQAVAAPGASGLTGNILSRPGSAGSGISTLSSGLQLNLNSSLAVPAPAALGPAVSPVVPIQAAPALAAPAALGAAPVLPAPDAQAPAAVLAAPAQEQSGALGSVKDAVQTIQADEAKSGAPEQGGVIGKLFDGGSRAAVPGGDRLAPLAGRDGSAASYLSQAPKTIFSEAIAIWKDAGAPSETDLQVKQDNGGLSDVGAERDLIEDAQVQTEPVKVELPEPAYGLDKVGLQRWVVTGGVKYAALVKGGVFWVDQTGNVFLYRRASAETVRIVVAPGKLGPVTVSEDGKNVYAVVDGRLQRWEIKDRELSAKSVKSESLDGAKITGLEPLNAEDAGRGDGAQILMAGKRFYWAKSKIVFQSEGAEQITKNGSLRSGLTLLGRSLYTEKAAGGTRVWLKPYFGSETKLEDLGTLPFEIKAIVAGDARGTYFAATAEGIVEWDVKTRRYRLFPVNGLEAAGQVLGLDVDPEGRVLVSGSHGLTQVELAPAREFLSSKSAEVRLWSQSNPMYIKDGALHIGDFSFPLARKALAPKSGLARLGAALKSLFGGKSAVPAEVSDMGISEKEWQALNLPTNKRLIYDTLKGFSLSQHMLYIGETGGGKTWIAERIAKLTGNELWMVSMNEYTRNKDLIARETFGEEGKNKTGLTMSTVLRWMTEGGILLLDEMHKPLEGIAVLNNILQNGEYRMPDGRIIKYDKKKSWVIGTMNPVKPPYKGEPPSGELSSRFGMTLEVKYLPADEEAALLNIFYSKVPRTVLDKLVAIANDLRKVYPDILPLPIAPRTLMHIVEHAARYPNDSIVDIFRKTY